MKVFSKFALLAALGASSMFAGTISFSSAPQTIVGAGTISFFLPQFDTTLGTLNSVIVDFNYTDIATIGVFNITSVAQSFTGATASIPIAINGPSGLLISLVASAGPLSGTTSINPGQNNYSGVAGSGDPSISIASGLFGSYQGLGFANLSFNIDPGNATYSGVAANQGALFFGGSSNVTGVTSIVYNYTAPSSTPEPATMSLFGGALLGIGFFARKRATKA